MSERDIVRYVASETCRGFHGDDTSFVKGLMGPIGSGKSSACVFELFYRSVKQEPDSDGVRKTKWGIVRNTRGELISTTVATVLQWMPSSIFRFVKSSPLRGTLNYGLPDGTRAYSEWLFFGLDRARDASKLQSIEFTGAWVNEAKEVPFEVVLGPHGGILSRIRRYPKLADGGYTWGGLIMDTNPPDTDSWWYKKFEQEKPENWRLFRQPGAMVRGADGKWEANPVAENVEHMKQGYRYWQDLLPSGNLDWQKAYIGGDYAAVFDGRGVYDGTWDDAAHVAKGPLAVLRGVPLFLGWDFGLTPACVMAQVHPGTGCLRVLREFFCERSGLRQFVEEQVKPCLVNEFSGMQVVSTGDPAGGQGGQVDEATCIGELGRLGIPTKPAEGNNFEGRKLAVEYFLTRRGVDGAAFQLDARCDMLRKGFLGGYLYKRVRVMAGQDMYADMPIKNKYSHVHDALQYLCMTAGTEGVRMLRLNAGVGRVQMDSWGAAV